MLYVHPTRPANFVDLRWQGSDGHSRLNTIKVRMCPPQPTYPIEITKPFPARCDSIRTRDNEVIGLLGSTVTYGYYSLVCTGEEQPRPK